MLHYIFFLPSSFLCSLDVAYRARTANRVRSPFGLVPSNIVDDDDAYEDDIFLSVFLLYSNLRPCKCICESYYFFFPIRSYFFLDE